MLVVCTTSFIFFIMKKYGKKYRKVLETLPESTLELSFSDAMKLLVGSSTTSFDATCEVHVVTSCDPRHADQIVRSTIELPHGTGRTVRIAVFCEEDKAEESKKAGADLVGGDDLIDKVLQGEINFDVALATPSMMKQLARAAKVLGPKGLMPSPKSGGVTDQLVGAITAVKKGKIEFKTDKQGIVHSIFGKVSFGAGVLEENFTSLMRAIVDAKPSGVKGVYIKDVFVTTSMGPSIRLDVAKISG